MSLAAASAQAQRGAPDAAFPMPCWAPGRVAAGSHAVTRRYAGLQSEKDTARPDSPVVMHSISPALDVAEGRNTPGSADDPLVDGHLNTAPPRPTSPTPRELQQRGNTDEEADHRPSDPAGRGTREMGDPAGRQGTLNTTTARPGSVRATGWAPPVALPSTSVFLAGSHPWQPSRESVDGRLVVAPHAGCVISRPAGCGHDDAAPASFCLGDAPLRVTFLPVWARSDAPIGLPSVYDDRWPAHRSPGTGYNYMRLQVCDHPLRACQIPPLPTPGVTPVTLPTSGTPRSAGAPLTHPTRPLTTGGAA